MGKVIFAVLFSLFIVFSWVTLGYSTDIVNPFPSQPPYCSFNEGTCTTKRNVNFRHINVYRTSTVGWVTSYQLSESPEPSTASAWIPATPDPIPFTLSANYGYKTVYLYVRNQKIGSTYTQILNYCKASISYKVSCEPPKSIPLQNTLPMQR
jgi:hypothetical protein